MAGGTVSVLHHWNTIDWLIWGITTRSTHLLIRVMLSMVSWHILSPETDNCPSWISGRERMTVKKKKNYGQSPWKSVVRPSRDQTRDLLITSQRHIWLIHQGQPLKHHTIFTLNVWIPWLLTILTLKLQQDHMTTVLSTSSFSIMKTCLFKYIENFTIKKGKFSDKKFWNLSYFCTKHRLWVLVRTTSVRWF